jgi:hypothetical protein
MLCGIFLSIAVRAEAQAPPTPYTAVFETGEQLLSACSAQLLPQFTGYVMGAADLLAAVSILFGGIGEYRVCRPVGVTADQTRGAVVQYLETHPAARQYGASYAVIQALTTTWPCR